MKKIVIFLLVMLSFTSCEEDVIKVRVQFEPTGFELDESVLDLNGDTSPFSHRLAGGFVSFSNQFHPYELTARNVHIHT